MLAPRLRSFPGRRASNHKPRVRAIISAVRLVIGQKNSPRLGSTICYGQELARNSHQDSAMQFVMAKRGLERASKTRQYDLLRPRVDQKKPPRLGSTFIYGQEELARKSHQDSAVRFVTVKHGPERATKTRQYDSLRPNVGQQEPARLGNTICFATKTQQCDLLRPRVGQKKPPRLGNTRCSAKSWPERATKTRQYDLLRPNVGQKKPPRLGS